MSLNVFQNSTVPILQELVGFTQARHELLAGNVANLDTPGYRVRDLSVDSFQAALRNVIDARNHSREAVSPGIMGRVPEEELHHVKESMKHILFHDGSDVSIEQQVAELSKNQFMHNLAISIMNSQFRLLQTAISERV